MLSYASFLPRSLTNHLTLTLTNHLMLCIRLFSTDLTLHSHNTVDVRRTLGPKKKKKDTETSSRLFNNILPHVKTCGLPTMQLKY